MPHTIFAASAPESPTFAANPQCESGIEDYTGGDLAEDFMQSQHQTQNSRAFSWPPGCSNLQQLQEMDALINIQRSQRDLPNSKQSCRSSHQASRGGNSGSHRAHGARVRVTCSYGDKCNQTFNRKTDLERHINTVHLRKRNKKCPFCGYGFGRGDILTRHLKGNGCPSKPRREPVEHGIASMSPSKIEDFV